MPGMHKSPNIEPKLSNSHRKITKKHLHNLRIDKLLDKKEQNKFIFLINSEFRKHGLTEIYSKRKLYEALSNKRYRYNCNLKKNKKLKFKINTIKIKEKTNYNNILLSDYDFNKFINELKEKDLLPIF